MATHNELFKAITTFVFDVDGVLTNGDIILLDNGMQARSMNTKDGFALQLAVQKGYRILIISGGVSAPVVDRLSKLGVTDIYTGVVHKLALLEDYAIQHQLTKNEILYMGDDIPDLASMAFVGLAACPADAVEEVASVSKYISLLPGGRGCVRDVVEKTLKARGDWELTDEIASK